MDDFLELSLLFEYYGSMLTETQQEICNLYYNQNLTLTEIAEDVGITKQGVRDALKKSEKLLYNYEKNLRIKEKNNQLGDLVQKIVTLTEDSAITAEIKDEIQNLTNQINELI